MTDFKGQDLQGSLPISWCMTNRCIIMCCAWVLGLGIAQRSPDVHWICEVKVLEAPIVGAVVRCVASWSGGHLQEMIANFYCGVLGLLGMSFV